VNASFIKPCWPAPDWVKAVTTTRIGGISAAPFSQFNLAMHVADNEASVLANRARLRENLSLAIEPVWLQQVHGSHIVTLDDNTPSQPIADGSVTFLDHQVCAVLTADCLPLLITDVEGQVVAAVHAGWRGLAAGVIDQAIDVIGQRPASLMVWMGPAIGQTAFEVGESVKRIFEQWNIDVSCCFRQAEEGKYFADLYHLARLRLGDLGVKHIFGGDYCTYRDAEHFYSYRREGRTGRQASLIWLDR